MKNLFACGAAMTAALAFASAVPAAASTHNYFTGRVEHVSTQNLKVRDTVHHQTLSFLLVPHFDQVFSGDGKTTSQMRKVHPGSFVRVQYDQHAFGARHADRIILLDSYGRGVKKIGS